MPAPTRPLPDDETLRRFLLGMLPGDESERLDELSIVDDDVAARLSVVEHDLVDSYVRGELSGQTLQRFQSQYAGSPSGQEKIRFARALAARVRPEVARRASMAADPKWMLAAAAAVILAAGYFVTENVRLRREVAAIRTANADLQRRTDQLVAQLNSQKQASSVVATFLLAPATRGLGGNVDVSLPPGAETVILRLPLDGSEYPQYEATIVDPSTSKPVWKSPRLTSRVAGSRPLILVAVPAAVLNPQQYALELSGLRTSGTGEPLNTYPFRVVTP